MALLKAWKVAHFQAVRKGWKRRQLVSVQVHLSGMPETKQDWGND